jgi:A/G-specific adenine glycosylase
VKLSPKLTPPSSAIFQRQLLAWYGAHARKLPWRKSCDPYRVWLSEIMLQQTRVAAVIEHYHEFLRCFPTIEKLAAAREATVLAAWSGLGYYRRARMLHAAAKVIMREQGSKFPHTSEGLRTLPGIGRYTAAAIASIAFGEPVAVVDGNVERVLQRISGKRLAGEKLWKMAESLLNRNRPGDFNQAMMELGATVCTPRAPLCLTCPVVKLCATRGEMNDAAIAARQKKREVDYALICRGQNSNGEVLLVRRAGNASMMAGMWELPEISSGAKAPVRWEKRNRSAEALRHPSTIAESEKQVPHRVSDSVRNDIFFVEGAKNALGRVARGEPLFTLRHSITVTNYTVRVWRGDAQKKADGKWFAANRLGGVALTGLARKILRHAKVLESKNRAR